MNGHANASGYCEPAEDGKAAFIIAAQILEKIVDLVAFRLADEDHFWRRRAVLGLLGLPVADWYCAMGASLAVYASPLSWLRPGVESCVGTPWIRPMYGAGLARPWPLKPSPPPDSPLRRPRRGITARTPRGFEPRRTREGRSLVTKTVPTCRAPAPRARGTFIRSLPGCRPPRGRSVRAGDVQMGTMIPFAGGGWPLRARHGNA